MQGIANFFQSLKIEAEIGVQLLCKESHISTRTYYKIMQHKTVKNECYIRLLVGICHAVDDDKFLERWQALGESLYWQYNND